MHEIDPQPFESTGPDLREQIVRLEARIDELAEASERCRRIRQIAKLAIILGAIWIAAAALGAVRLNAMSLVGSITFLIGGIVAFGSNASTWQQVTDGIDKAQAERAALIGRMRLALVRDPETQPE